MFFTSVKIVNRLISKAMSNIYLKSYYREKLTFSKRRFCKFKGLEANAYVDFLLFQLSKELWRFKVKESMSFVEQKYKLW